MWLFSKQLLQEPTSSKKLVPPATQVTCLGILIDTIKETISISPEKLEQINQAVSQWLSKDVASKHQLQSILGLLLYIFLNKMF